MRPFIVVGDTAANGAVVISGATSADIQGRKMARMGDPVACAAQCKRGSCTIASGDPTVIIEGRPAARQGDSTACGSPLVPGHTCTHIA